MQICNKIPDPVKHKKTLSKLLQSQLTTKEQDPEKIGNKRKKKHTEEKINKQCLAIA